MKAIAVRLHEVYKEIKKKLPGLHHLTVEIDEYDHMSGQHLQGWIQHGDLCYNYHSVDGLNNYVDSFAHSRKAKEILFRKF